MSRLLAFALCGGLAVSASPALAWGPIGHRVSAELAERNISGRTRAQVKAILGQESLPEAATRPDEERSNPEPFWQEMTYLVAAMTLVEVLVVVGVAVGYLVFGRGRDFTSTSGAPGHVEFLVGDVGEEERGSEPASAGKWNPFRRR